MSHASEWLREFHEAFGIPGEKTLAGIVEGRKRLHEEEAHELHRALQTYGQGVHVDPPDVKRAGLMAVAEELADVLIVAYGTADVLGVDLDEAFGLKMEGNMAKLPRCPDCTSGRRYGVIDTTSWEWCATCEGRGRLAPIKNEQGKVLKPDGWVKPSMAAAIK